MKSGDNYPHGGDYERDQPGDEGKDCFFFFKHNLDI